MTVPILTTTRALEAFCARAANEAFVTIDTEFMRERTYRPVLCLLQLALPTRKRPNAVLVDPLAGEIDLGCLFALLANRQVVKVFHAGSQDIEILWQLGRCLPEPLFDTQIAAMVCGFGFQASYESLVVALTERSIPAGAAVTNWQRRPLTARQMQYALADVTHLRDIYLRLCEILETNGRRSWLDGEFAKLTDPATHEQDPVRAWERIKVKHAKPATLAVVRELAAMRERVAGEHNILRKHVMSDHALMEIAQLRPCSLADLHKTRFFSSKGKINRFGKAILAAVRQGLACPPEQYPRPKSAATRPAGKATLEFLRVLLAAKAEEHGVAAQFIASADDLKALAQGHDAGPVMHGWRYDLFGRDALRLCEGRIALFLGNGSVKTIERDRGSDGPPPG